MTKKEKILTLLILSFAAANLIYGWIAISSAGFAREVVVPGVAALIAFAIGVIGLALRQPWVFGGGMIAAFVFCPSPFAFIPLLIGSVLLTVYAVTVHNSRHKEG